MGVDNICSYFDGEIIVDESQYVAGLVVENNSYEANVEIPMIKVVGDNEGRNADEQYWYKIMQDEAYIDSRYPYRVLLGYYAYDDSDELYYNVANNMYDRILGKFDYEKPAINSKIAIAMNESSLAHENIKIGHIIIYSSIDRVFINTNSDPNVKYVVLDGLKTSTNQYGGFYNNNIERIELMNVDRYVPIENLPGIQSTFREMPMLREFPKIDTSKVKQFTAAFAYCPQASGELELDYSSITLINYAMPLLASTAINRVIVGPCNKIEGTFMDADGNLTTSYTIMFNVKSLFQLYASKIAWGNLNVSNAIQLAKESLLFCINELIPTTPDKPKIFKLGQINLNKLSESEIKIATNKNWILTA